MLNLIAESGASLSSRLLRRFASCIRGSAAIAFGLSLIPMMGIAGMAIDYASALRANQLLKAAADAASLAVAQSGATNPDAAEDVAMAYFPDNSPLRSMLKYFDVQVKIEANNVYAVTASGSLPTTLTKVLGIDALKLNITSKAAVGMGTAEIALVLDNTGSMAGARIDALKSASALLLDKIEAATDPSTRKVGLVPFGQYVNVGLSSRGQPWLSVPNDYVETTTECEMERPIVSKTNCRMVTKTVTRYTQGAPYQVAVTSVVDGVSTVTYKTRYEQGTPYQETVTEEECDYVYGDPVSVCETDTDDHEWEGCVGSRNYPLNTQALADITNPVPGIMDVECTEGLTRLTSDLSSIRSRISSMSPSGETYIPSGLIWGWRVLSHQSPFADGADPSNAAVRKIMVLMTDGANTKSPRYPDHKGSDAALANRLSLELCTNIKAAGIQIFTVAFNVTDPTALDVMTRCATGRPYAYSASGATELAEAFSKIGQSLAQLRLVQ